ncbi:MAG: DUF4019 domain-containing protein [Chlamydiia bacterium]|nr:DUF4019 domain-containing protein [Chlamydiia bacterium]
MHLCKTLLLLVVLVSSLFGDSNASNPPYSYEESGKLSPMVSESRADAMSWITLMDQLQYGPTWDEAGPIFKDTITRKQWTAAMNEIRRPLGYASSRKIEKQHAIKKLNFGTTGDFMKIIYQTNFWGKASAREICILMYTGDVNRGRWQVISYTIE